MRAVGHIMDPRWHGARRPDLHSRRQGRPSVLAHLEAGDIVLANSGRARDVGV